MDLMTISTAGVAVATCLLFVATAFLGWQAREHTREMRRGRKLQEAERIRKTTPIIRAWLESNQGKVAGLGMEFAWLVIGNVGEGTAENLRWWFEDMDEEEWSHRWDSYAGDPSTPDKEENSAGQQVLRAGSEVRAVLWGKDRVRKPFTIQIRYETTGGAGRTEQEATRLVPELLYIRGGGEPDDALKHIKESMGKMEVHMRAIARNSAKEGSGETPDQALTRFMGA